MPLDNDTFQLITSPDQLITKQEIQQEVLPPHENNHRMVCHSFVGMSLQLDGCMEIKICNNIPFYLEI